MSEGTAQRVVERYAATMSKRQKTIIEVLKRGGYLRQSGRFYSLIDPKGQDGMTMLPAQPIMTMWGRGILESGKERGTLVLDPAWGKPKPRRKPGPPDDAAGYVQTGVLAAGYGEGVQKNKRFLAHAIWVDKSGGWLGDKTVCNKIDLEQMADAGQDKDLCSTCATRVRKYRLPRMRQHEN
jgi:hypothetical protein